MPFLNPFVTSSRPCTSSNGLASSCRLATKSPGSPRLTCTPAASRLSSAAPISPPKTISSCSSKTSTPKKIPNIFLPAPPKVWTSSAPSAIPTSNFSTIFSTSKLPKATSSKSSRKTSISSALSTLPTFPAGIIPAPAKSITPIFIASSPNCIIPVTRPWNSIPWAIPPRNCARLASLSFRAPAPRVRRVPSNQSLGGSMNRRDALRMLAAGAVLPALTPELLAFYQQAQPGASYALRTLNPHQNETVVSMIDQIIPATDTPGAKAARVNEFIDVILTEWANDEERRSFLDASPMWTKQAARSSAKTSLPPLPPSSLFFSVPGRGRRASPLSGTGKRTSALLGARWPPRADAGRLLHRVQEHDPPRLLHFGNRIPAGVEAVNHPGCVPWLRTARPRPW